MAQTLYGPGVRMGNWNEDVYLEEELLKDFLEKRNKGQLLIQRNRRLKDHLLRPMQLSVSADGCVHHGDTVMLVNPGPPAAEAGVVLSGDLSLCLTPDEIRAHLSDTLEVPCGLSAAPTSSPVSRNTFVILSADGATAGDVLRYGQNFRVGIPGGVWRQNGALPRGVPAWDPSFCSCQLVASRRRGQGAVQAWTPSAPPFRQPRASSSSNFEHFKRLYLTSDHRTLLKSSRRSWLQDVYLTDEASFLNCWQAALPDPQLRLEHDGLPVPANAKILINHSHTNRGLAAHRQLLLRTYFGKEAEVAAHTHLDSHRVEKPENHWMLVTGNPRTDTPTRVGAPGPAPPDAAGAPSPSTHGVRAPDSERCPDGREREHYSVGLGELGTPGTAQKGS